MSTTQILPAASVTQICNFSAHKLKDQNISPSSDCSFSPERCPCFTALCWMWHLFLYLLLKSSMILRNLNSKHWKENLAFCYLIYKPSFPLCTLCLGSYVFWKHKENSSANLSTSHPSVMSALHLFCYITMHRMFDADVLTWVVEQNEICCFLPLPPSKKGLFKLLFKNNRILRDNEWLLNAFSQGVALLL